MREIKFRAWDSLIKHFTECSFSIVRGTITKNSEIEINQFTGLKDKNGKEIYEGDIIKDIDGIIWKVYFVNGAFSKFCSTKELKKAINIQPRIKSDERKLADELGIWWTSCEVIGNIYENPELLEEGK